MERVWNLLFWLNGRLWLIPAIMSIAALGLQAAASSPSVLIGLARRLSDLLHVAATPAQKQAVTKHLNMLQRAAHAIPEPLDREDLLNVIRTALADEPG